MTRPARSNLPASVRQRLLNISRERGADPNLIWTRYALERFLYRLGRSEYADEFVLKGALLFLVWTGESCRPTRDLDLLRSGAEPGEPVADVFRRVCEIDVEPDGLRFDSQSVRVEPIRGPDEYHGQRVRLTAFLGKARIPLRMDVAFGDVVRPRAERVEYPTLLDFPAPCVRACPRETVVAEKLHAAVDLGMMNSRMKDFYDLYVLACDFSFDRAVLSEAVSATFKRRQTPVPVSTPVALTDEFASDRAKVAQWKAFLRRTGLSGSTPDLRQVMSQIQIFLVPVFDSLTAAKDRATLPATWRPGGPWE